MKDYRSLRVLDKFEAIFNKLGADYPVMRRILQVKLTMDGRRSTTILQGAFNNKKAAEQHNDESNQFIKSLWIYALMGLIMVPFLLMGKHYLFQMSLVFGIFSFLIMTTMISDFSSVLLDVRDQNILFTKPISRRTMNLAKTVHVSMYLFYLTSALMAAPLLASLFRQGIWFTFIFIMEIVLLDLFFLVLTAMLYLFILQFFDGEKLKDIINYVQISLSIMIMLAYQLLARSFEIIRMNIVFQLKWWQIFIPPLWYGAFTEMLFQKKIDGSHIAFSILALVVPILAIIVYIQFIPSFERNLLKLSHEGVGGRRSGSFIPDRYLKWVCREPMEWTFFRFAVNMLKNEREFKLKVYPSFGFAMVFPFIFIFNELRTSSWAALSASKWYLTIYFTFTLIPTVILMLRYSGTYKGAWIYKVTPIASTSSIFKGTMKAFIIKLFFPMFLWESIIYVGIFGWKVVPDLCLVLLNASLYAIICFLSMNKALPFSESFQWAQQRDTWKVFLLLFLIVGISAVHYFSTSAPYGTYIFILISAVLNGLLWRYAFRVQTVKRAAASASE
ncbi:hypothetical protein GK047_14560 [Paenibacillus sp. SYP-B3998]|uniref:Uncharacterized protein n=1 Tax=Paenibacillus sp. SYP-B3998 TaxID=2678564 RepID=A0A6G3ZYV0_9BACL|nr:hypothetical protein [Paenibacillus sp. SYP-B3998]NEW07228.1 hypothetical protein [Paenibacillus sp. SYP-B3998]